MANRLLGTPNKFPAQQFQNDRDYPQINIRNFDSGMNTENDWADLEDKEFLLLDGIFAKDGKMILQRGESISDTSPSGRRIDELYSALQYDGSNIQLAFTSAGGSYYAYRRIAGGTWTVISAAVTAISAPPNNILSADNRHFFSNDGYDYIQEIDLNANEYDRLGNAPKCKYITSFFNRIVAAYDTTDPSPIKVSWSGDFNFGEWDPTADITAGFAYLEESQSDYADFITGLEGFANQMVILRTSSIWLANKTPGINPFFFYTAVPNQGCDTPASVQRIPNGIIFYDKRSNNFYRFDVKEGLMVIGEKIRDFVINGFGYTNPTNVINIATAKSSYDPVDMIYRFFGPDNSGTGSTVLAFSLRTGSWSIESKSYLMTCMTSTYYQEPSTLIQDLNPAPDGYIASLPGAIEDLGAEIGIQNVTTFIGDASGNVREPDDSDRVGRLITKLWTPPDNNDFYVQRVVLEYLPLGTGEFTISLLKTSNLDTTPFYTKTVNYLAANKGQRLVVTCNRSIKTREFGIQLDFDGQQVCLLSIKALTVPSGYTQ